MSIYPYYVVLKWLFKGKIAFISPLIPPASLETEVASLSLVVSLNEYYQSIHKLAFVLPFSWILNITEGNLFFFFFFFAMQRHTSRVLRVFL